MATLSKIQIGERARALAVALAFGAVVLSLTPGQTAHAARGTSNEVGDADTGGPGSGPKSKTKNIDVNDPKSMCTITTSDGTLHFYLPGDKVVVGTQDGNRTMVCGGPDWLVMRPDTGPTVNTGGGVLQTVP